MPQPNDFLVKRETKASEAHPADGAQFTWFGPVDAPEQRHRFLIVREDGDTISLVPGGEAKFKAGLSAWRWKAGKSEDPAERPVGYLVVKTTARRVDLRRSR